MSTQKSAVYIIPAPEVSNIVQEKVKLMRKREKCTLVRTMVCDHKRRRLATGFTLKVLFWFIVIMTLFMIIMVLLAHYEAL